MRLVTAIAFAMAAVCCSAPDDWQRKDAWRMCNAAISDWPTTPAPPCEAMHMCANEAPLSPEARDKLSKMIAVTPGCAAP